MAGNRLDGKICAAPENVQRCRRTIYAWKPNALGEKNTDAEIDYTFRSAIALGASHVTVEIPSNPAQSKRLGAFAQKYKIGVGYHGHLQQTITAWDEALSQSPYNGLNCDLGHYVAAGFDPIPLLEAKHDRIYSAHLKDRKSKANGGANLPWVKEILHLSLPSSSCGTTSINSGNY